MNLVYKTDSGLYCFYVVTSMTSDQSDQLTTPAAQACVVSKPSNEETSSSDKQVLNLTLRLRYYFVLYVYQCQRND